MAEAISDGTVDSKGFTDPPKESSMPHIYWTREPAAVDSEDTPPPIPPRQGVPLRSERPTKLSGSTDPPEEGSMPHIYWTLETSTAAVSKEREQPPEQSGSEPHYYWTLVTNENKATPLDEDGYATIADFPRTTTDDAGYEILPHLSRELPNLPSALHSPLPFDRNEPTGVVDDAGYEVLREEERVLRISQKREKFIASSFAAPGTAPISPAHAIRWFREVEAPKGVGREKDGSISPWFHGLCGRKRAENLLKDKPVGSYLVRLGTRIWGYVISYKNLNRYSHIMVHAHKNQYRTSKPDEDGIPSFGTLQELLNHYSSSSFGLLGSEIRQLTQPVQQDNDSGELFRGLFNDTPIAREDSPSGFERPSTKNSPLSIPPQAKGLAPVPTWTNIEDSPPPVPLRKGHVE